MSSNTSTKRKTSLSKVTRRVSSVTKETTRTSNRSQVRRPSQSLRVSNVGQQTTSIERLQNNINEMNFNQFLSPPRPPDSTLFIRAGTTGNRHLLPIHLTEHDCNDGIFSRSISRIRSRTPTTELCTNIEMIRNICLSIKTLQHFDVSENDLTDLPLDITLLIDLETLNCSYNRLTTIPNLFEQLKYLKEIDLSFNLFKQLPNVIYTFKYLIRLNCEQNSINILDSNLLNLKRLKFFVFDHNQLETTDSIDFSQLKKLEYINIAHNQLTKFPHGLHQLQYLKNVNLSNNRLTSVPIDLFLVKTLDVLNLSHNLISKLLPMPVAYKRSSMIFSIDLSYNQLTKFYDYLLLIALKIDLSNNKIRMISNDILKKLNNDMINSRELKIQNNPLTQPTIPWEILHGDSSNAVNVLRMIRNCFDEQQSETRARQGFKISIIGPKSSGKTALANCLEEHMPLVIDENNQESQERIIYVHQYQFRVLSANDQLSSRKTSTSTNLHMGSTVQTNKTTTATNTTPEELPKIQLQRFEKDTRKRKNPSSQTSKQSTSKQAQPISSLPIFLPSTPTVSVAPPPPPSEPIKVLPLTSFDFNGSSEYYEHMIPFLDTNSLHLICIHAADFHRSTPTVIQEIFHDTRIQSSSNIVQQLFQLLQLLCDKATKTRPLMIIPIATCIDLYDERPNAKRIEAIEKINQFFRCYIQHRRDRIKTQMESIHSLSTISSSLSDRLKTYTSLLSVTIQIEPCQPISSLTFQGIDELHQMIQRCVLTQKTIFPYVDRILPTLWTEANQYIESLADLLPAPYLLWENFSERVIRKYGLAHLINEIAMSLHDEGKILILNEISTNDRAVFLRPSWLADLLHNLFRQDMTKTFLDYDTNEIFTMNNISESRFQLYKKEFLQYGILHSDLLYAFWCNLLYKKEDFYHLWLTIMRFFLIGYPKMNKEQLKRLIHVETSDSTLQSEKSYNHFIDIKQNPYEYEDIQFDYAIVPYYLPILSQTDQDDELKRFNNRLSNIITIRYTSEKFPLGFFHRLSVGLIIQLNIIYKKHWNNFLIGQHEEKDVKFIMETDHQTYIKCHCGTSHTEQPFEEIWNVLMLILNYCEDIFTSLAPNHRFDRAVQCPHCKEFSFMGEWTTPKELQCLKMKACSMCNENIDTGRLVQPNESKRRSEELLRKIRERHAKQSNKESDDVPQTTSTNTHLLVVPV